MCQLLLVRRRSYTRIADRLISKESLCIGTMQTMSPEEQPETPDEIEPTCCITGDAQDGGPVSCADKCERSQPTCEPHNPEAKIAKPKRSMGAVTFDESTKDEPASDEGNSATSDQETSPGAAPGKTRPVKRRKSVQQLITGFDTLRECLGVYPPDRHLSRIDTLRMAMAHISDLQNTLREADRAEAVAAASLETDSGLGVFQLGSAGAGGCPQLFFTSGDFSSHPSTRCSHHPSPFCTSELGVDLSAVEGFERNPFFNAAGMAGGLNSALDTGIPQDTTIPPSNLQAGGSSEALLNVALSASPASNSSLVNVASPNSLLGLHSLLLGGSPNFPSLDNLCAASLTDASLQSPMDAVSPPVLNLLSSTLPTLADAIRLPTVAPHVPQQLSRQSSPTLSISASTSMANVNFGVPSSNAGV